MQFIDIVIEAVTLASVIYFSLMFISGLGRRSAKGAEAPTAPTKSIPVITDCVVPFKRPVRAMPSDRELIALGKRTGFPGAAKWSYSRKLTQKARAELLEVWKQAA